MKGLYHNTLPLYRLTTTRLPTRVRNFKLSSFFSFYYFFGGPFGLSRFSIVYGTIKCISEIRVSFMNIIGKYCKHFGLILIPNLRVRGNNNVLLLLLLELPKITILSFIINASLTT